MAGPWRHVWAVNDVAGAGTMNPLMQMHNVTSGSFSGQTPADATTTPYLIQAGVLSFTTDSAGNSNITFPSTFPNGCLSLVAAITFGGGDRTWILEYGNNVSAGGCGCSVLYVNDNTSRSVVGVGSTFVTVSYIAIGW